MVKSFVEIIARYLFNLTIVLLWRYNYTRKRGLDKARVALGRMLDFAVYELKYDITVFFDTFIASGVAREFENGDAGILVGKSGVELTYEVLERTGSMERRLKAYYCAVKSPEYWTGWALAYYQWQTALSFAEIVRYVPIMHIIALYEPYHEMDIRQFVDKMNELYHEAKTDTNLKILRRRSGYTQKELALSTGIPIRTIQQYEQRQKDINKASAEYLYAISKVLRCEIRELMEIQTCLHVNNG